MQSDNVIFDIQCVSMGLPPLSMGVASAYDMIKKMPPSEKRKILRKVRKVAKLEINRRTRRQASAPKKEVTRSIMERSSNLCKDKKKHESKYILNRLRLAIDYIDHMARTS